MDRQLEVLSTINKESVEDGSFYADVGKVQSEKVRKSAKEVESCSLESNGFRRVVNVYSNGTDENIKGLEAIVARK